MLICSDLQEGYFGGGGLGVGTHVLGGGFPWVFLCVFLGGFVVVVAVILFGWFFFLKCEGTSPKYLASALLLL